MKKFEIINILVPTDFSKTANAALEHAHLMARLFNAKIHILHVVQYVYPVLHDGLMIPPHTFHSSMKKHANKLMKKTANDLHLNHNIRAKTAISTGAVSAQINNYSQKNNIDIIIMGTRGVSGLKEYFIGSNAYRVVDNSPCPVLTVNKKQKIYGYRNILLPIRDADHSREKIDYIIKLAKQYNSKVHLVFYSSFIDKLSAKRIEKIKKQVEFYLAAQHVPFSSRYLKGSSYFKTLSKYAKSINADMIAIMAQRSKGISQLFSGTYTQQLVNHSDIPVLCVPVYYNSKLLHLWQFS